MKLVKTSHAKNKIRNWFKKERREENIEKGKEMLEKEIRRANIVRHLVLKSELLEEAGRSFNLLSADDLYAAVGYGGVSVNQVLNRLREEYKRRYGDREQEQEQPLPEVKPTKHLKQTSPGISVQGVDNLLVRIARCCNPVPGDNVIGFITRGRGVSVHRRDCPNLANQANSNRFLEVSWEEEANVSYPVEIEINAVDRKNLLADIMNVVNESKVDITAVTARADKDQIATIYMTMVVRDQVHLDQIMAKVKKVKDVYAVRRYVYGSNSQA